MGMHFDEDGRLRVRPRIRAKGPQPVRAGKVRMPRFCLKRPSGFNATFGPSTLGPQLSLGGG
eukprot:5765386-Lingulodinium_polyedra.AAC.1